MQYVKLGRTGLDVSRICLGCMSYGDAASGGHPWALDEETARPFYVQALDADIDAAVAKSPSFQTKLTTSAEHMVMTADILAGGIAKNKNLS